MAGNSFPLFFFVQLYSLTNDYWKNAAKNKRRKSQITCYHIHSKKKTSPFFLLLLDIEKKEFQTFSIAKQKVYF
jgi:heat shock protein HspQ